MTPKTKKEGYSLMIDNFKLNRMPILNFKERKWYNPLRYIKGRFKTLPSIYEGRI